MVEERARRATQRMQSTPEALQVVVGSFLVVDLNFVHSVLLESRYGGPTQLAPGLPKDVVGQPWHLADLLGAQGRLGGDPPQPPQQRTWWVPVVDLNERVRVADVCTDLFVARGQEHERAPGLLVLLRLVPRDELCLDVRRRHEVRQPRGAEVGGLQGRPRVDVRREDGIDQPVERLHVLSDAVVDVAVGHIGLQPQDVQAVPHLDPTHVQQVLEELPVFPAVDHDAAKPSVCACRKPHLMPHIGRHWAAVAEEPAVPPEDLVPAEAGHLLEPLAYAHQGDVGERGVRERDAHAGVPEGRDGQRLVEGVDVAGLEILRGPLHGLQARSHGRAVWASRLHRLGRRRVGNSRICRPHADGAGRSLYPMFEVPVASIH
mmetsp:Transcript_47381/g.133287  ORF Transcript_47381/g.133287 Transcript_47381/m.133287 type:complete len:375 (-) Transcript_47381:22-1146(-)